MKNPAPRRNLPFASGNYSFTAHGAFAGGQELITIEEFIDKAKKAGYRFGKGNPKNRLRYLTKTGVLPHAVRLQVKETDAHTTGFYPESAIQLLLSAQKLKRQEKLSAEKIADRVEGIVSAVERGALPDSLVTTLRRERLRSTALLRSPSFGGQASKLFLPAFAGAAVFLIVLSQTVFGKALGEKMVGGMRAALFPREALRQMAEETGLKDEGRRTKDEGKVLAEEDLKGSDLPKDLILSVNLLKNSSFESAGSTAPAAFWQFHPNSTDGNTQKSSHTSHSGSYSLLLHDAECEVSQTSQDGSLRNCVLGVLQESTKTAANRSYTLGAWVKTVNSYPLTVNRPKLHLAFGPGWDKEIEIRDQRTENSDGWQYYSATFENPPPGLVPRIYIVSSQESPVQLQTGDSWFIFVDDAGMSENFVFAQGPRDEGQGLRENQVSSAFSLYPLAFSPLVPSGGNVLSVSADGILYPTDDSQTQGGLGTDSNRFGKAWLTNVDLSENLSINGKLDLSGKLTANGNLVLGNNDGDEIEVGGRFTSDLLPKQSNAVSLGTSGNRWNNLFIAAANLSNNLTVGGTATITGLLTVNGGLTASGGSGLSVTGDLSLDGDLDFQGPQNITTTSDNLTVSPTGNLILDSSGGTLAIRDAAIDLTNQATTVSGSTLTLRSTGTFIIDTSANNTDLRLQGGLGELRGDYGTIVLAGANSITLDTSSANSQLRIATGTGAVSVSSGALTAAVSQLTLTASSGPVSLWTSSNSNGEIRLRSAGSLSLDTSANNTNVQVSTGTGDFNVNAGQLVVDGNGSISLSPSNSQLTITGNTDISSGLDVTGTTTLGDGGTTNYLSVSSTGDLTFLGSANNLIANNDLVIRSANSLTLDTSASNNNLVINTGSGTLNASVGAFTLTTSSYTQTTNGAVNRTVEGTITDRIVGSNNYVLRVGNAASDSIANGNDIFLAAVDQIILKSASFSQTTSGNTETIVSAGDYSVLVQGNNDIYLRGGGAGRDNATDGGDLQLAAQDSLIVDAGDLTLTASEDNARALVLAASRGGILLSSSAAGGSGDIRVIGAGTITLDTSAKNSNIRIQTGSGTLSGSVGTATLSTENGGLTLLSRTSPLSLITESTTNGPMYLSSTGTLTLDTSRTGAGMFLQGGLVRVGSGGTVNNASGSGALYVQGTLEVDGNVYLGDISTDDIVLTGQVGSNLIPNVGSTYTLGNTTNRWSEIWGDTLTVTTLNSSANNITGITSNSFTIDTSNTTADTQDISITFERGTPATNSQLLWDASEKYFSFNAALNISPDTDITTLAGEHAILNVNDSYRGRRIATFSEGGTPRAVIDSSGNILLFQSSNIETSAGALTLRGYSGLTLTTSTASTGEIRVISRGTLQLDTSANNDNILVRTGTGQFDLISSRAAINAISLAATNGGVDISTSGVGGLGELRLRSGGSLKIDTSGNNNNILIDSGSGDLLANIGSGNLVAEDDAVSALIFRASAGGIQLSTQSADNGNLTLYSAGTLTLDTSRNNTNVLILPGTGNVGIGSTAPVYKLDVNGTLRTTSTARVEGALTVTTGGASVTGDLTLDGDLDFTGPQNITTTADDLTLSPTGNLIVDTSGGMLSIRDAGIDLTNQPTTISGSSLTLRATGNFILDTSASNTNLVLQGGTGGLTGSFGTVNLTAVTDSVSAVYLNSQRGGITLSSSNASGSGPIRILSGGSLQLSTSQGNQPIYLQAGTGNLNVSSNQLYLTGNLVVTGTETFNGVAYTFPGADGSASNVLTTSGTGLLSWGTLGAGSITADSLDFTEFQDSLDLDADTSINGPYSFIIRTGNAARQNATSGNNDLQLSAEDALIVDAGDISITASEDSTYPLIFRSSAGGIQLSTQSSDNGNLTLYSAGTLTLDSSRNNTNIILSPGTGNVGIGTTAPGYKLEVNGAIKTNDSGFYAGFTDSIFYRDGSTGRATILGQNGVKIQVVSGTDQILLTNGVTSITGNVGIGTTAPGGILDVIGNSSIVLRAGQGSVQGSGLGTTSTTADIQLAAADSFVLNAGDLTLTASEDSTYPIILRSAQGGIQLSTQSSDNGNLTLYSAGTLTLDTSRNNTNIQLSAGTGTLNVSAATARLTGNLIVTGTETFNGVTYTFPGGDGSASNVLTTSGTGLLSWGTLGAASITADSLDFTEFQDSLDLDADTSINGPYSFIIRAGQGSIENSASGNNDLQLAAADKLILAGASFDLSTSSGGVDIISAARIDLSGRGTLTLDTSQANANIVLTPGSGNVGIGSTAPVYKLDVNGTLRTTSTARVEGALTVTTGGASVTGDLTLDGDLDFTGPQNITTTADDLTLSPTGNLIVDTSGGMLSIRDAGIDLTNQPTTISGSSLTLRATGNFILDTSASNTNLVLQGGTGGLTGSFGTINLTAVTDSVSAVYLNSQRGGITLSSSNASGSGPIRILSGGSLQLSTSQGNQPIYLQAGTGNLNVSSNQLYLTGNLVVTGTETFNGVAYTFPGADGSASNVLTTSGTGLLSWGTLGAGSITADSLDFSEFKDEMTLDADTSINGDYSLIVRAGLGARQNATSGSNDLQLSAEDQILIHGTALTLETSSTTAGQMLLRSDGSMTFDTSGGTGNFAFVGGNVGIGTTGPSRKLEISGTGNYATGPALKLTDTAGTSWTLVSQSDGAFQLFGGAIDSRMHVRSSTHANPGFTFWGNVGMGAEDLTPDASLEIVKSGSIDLLALSSAAANDGDLFIVKNSGNVGIGTTSPQGILDVLGQCVAKGTRIRLRRKKRRAKGQGPRAKGDTDTDSLSPYPLALSPNDWQELELPIEEVKAGDEVLTLDEQTGKFVWQTVEKTMDKGIQATFELITASGKRIETTGNHPYLVRLTADRAGSSGRSFGFGKLDGDVSQQNHDQQQGGGDLNIGIDGPKIGGAHNFLSNINARYKDNVPNTISYVKTKKLLSSPTGQKLGAIRTTPYQAAARLTQSPDKMRENAFRSFFDKELDMKNRLTDWIKVVNLKVGMEIATIDGFERIVSIKQTGRKQTYDLQIEATHNFVAGHYVNRRTGTALTAEQEKLYLEWHQSQQHASFGSWFTSMQPKSAAAGLGFTSEFSETENSGESKKTASCEAVDCSTGLIPLPHTENSVTQKNGSVNSGGEPGNRTLSPRGRTACEADSNTRQTDSPTKTILARLRKAGVNPEEVEFGGIVAHNTSGLLMRAGASSLQLSSSATSTTADIQLAAADRIDMFAGSFNLTTSNTSDGSLKLTSYGNLTLDTSQNNGNIIFNTGTGGITQNLGTYTVNATTDQIGAIALNATRGGITLSSSMASSNGNIYLKSAGTLQLDTSAKNANILLMPGTGNVGIGTTAPGYKLEVNGAIKTNDSGFYAGFTDSIFYRDGSTGRATILGQNGVKIQVVSGTDQILLTNGVTSITGNVGIGTTAPGGILDVIGNSSIVLRAGQGSVQGSGLGTTSTTADIQLAAADSLALNAGDLTINASEDSTYPIILRSSQGGIQLSTQSSDNGNLTLYSAGTLTLDSSRNNTNIILSPGTGNVGIGTTAPGQILHIYTSSSALGKFQTTAADYGRVSIDAPTNADSQVTFQEGSGTRWTIGNDGSDSDKFKIMPTTVGAFDGTEVLTITTTGNVGIGTTGPLGILDVKGDSGILLKAGAAAISLSSGTTSSSDLQLAAADRIDLFAGSLSLQTSSTTAGDLKIMSNGSLMLDTSQNNTNILMKTGSGNINVSTGTLTMTGVLDVRDSTGTLGLAVDSTGNVGIGTTGPATALHIYRPTTVTTLRLEQAGAGEETTIQLVGDSTRYNWEIGKQQVGNALTFAASTAVGGTTFTDFKMTILNTGNVGIGTTTPLYTLDVSGGTRVIGNAGVILRAGTSSLNLSSGTTSTTADLQLAAADRIDLFAGSLSLQTSSQTAGELKFMSKGSLILDTSGAAGGGAPIRLQAGTGNVQVSSTQLYLTGNLVVTGTETFNGVAYTFPGADGSASNVLTTSGTGLLSWGTLGAGSITADSLDFSEFKDEMTLDADTTISGDQSLVIRTGLGARQNATSGSNDLQLAAEDAMILDADDFTLTTSNTGVSSLQLISKGVLRLDTSINSNNILLLPGTGNVGIGTTNPAHKLHLEDTNQVQMGLYSTNADTGTRNWGLFTSNIVHGDFNLMQSNARLGNPITAGTSRLYIKNDGNVGIGSTSPAGILDIGTSAAGILLRAGQPGITISSSSAGNTADIQLAAPDRVDIFASSFSLTTSNTADGSLKLTSYGNLTLDTSQNNGNIIFNTGTGGITQNLGTYTVNATTDQIGAIALNATRGGITLSTSQASSNGNLYLKSAGTLQLDTSAKNAAILLRPGTGGVGIGADTSPDNLLDIEGAVLGRALVAINETGDQAILTASASGTPRFTVGRSDITVNGQKDLITSGMTNVNDVFVYDTTKDADGGLWRVDSRAKASSWYNETLDDGASDPCANDTDDRCGRREFPEKAIIVATNTDLYIFDAKDNSQWMNFDITQSWNSDNMLRANVIGSVFAMDGKIYAGSRAGSGFGLDVIDFIRDTSYLYSTSTSFSGTYNGTVSQRNGALGFTTGTLPVIVNDYVNDVSAAVICGGMADASASPVISSEPPAGGESRDLAAGDPDISIASLDSSTRPDSGSGLARNDGEAEPRLLSYAEWGQEQRDFKKHERSSLNFKVNSGGSEGTGNKKATPYEVALNGTVDSRTSDTVHSVSTINNVVNSGGEPENRTREDPWRSILEGLSLKNLFTPEQAYAAAGPSCKTYVAVATDAGVSVINETDQRVFDYTNTSGADAYSVELAADGTLYFSEAKNDELAVFTNIQNDTADQTSADRTYDESSGVALWSSAPSITGSAGSLTVTQGTSTVDGNSNTIYIGHSGGMSRIDEKASDQANGSVKYYTNARITEEMAGDIRLMLPMTEDPADNGTFTDASVKGNTMKLEDADGNSTTATGVRGAGFDINSGTDYIWRDADGDNVLDVGNTQDDDSDFDITSNLTVGAWIYPSTVAGSDSIISKYRAGSVANSAYWLRLSDGTPQFITDGSSEVNSAASSAITANTWHFVVGVFDDSANRQYLYVDGVQVDSDTQSASLNSNSNYPLLIGASIDATDSVASLYDGVIDEPFVTAEALTPAQIKHMYEVGKRALQNHTASRIVGVTGADNYQRLMGNASGGTSSSNNVSAVAVDDNNQYIYAGINDATTNTGGVTVIGTNSDSAVDLYDATANTAKDDDAGTQFSASDVVAISVAGSPCPDYNVVTGKPQSCNNQATVAIAGTNDSATRVWMETSDLSLFSTLAGVAGTSLYKAGDITAGSALKVMSASRLSLDTSTAEPEPVASFMVDQTGNLSVNSFSLDASGGTISIGQISATPAASDVVGSLNFTGRTLGASGQRDVTFGGIRGIISSATDQSEAGILSFLTMRAGTLTEAARFDNSGNLGVGTTSPGGILDVLGQCVTGDTVLRRRKRRAKGQRLKAKGSNPPDSLGPWPLALGPDDDWEDVRIDQIKEGDEILTLDEQTGEFETQVVEKLMDMGVKSTFKLTTEDDKRIQTTAEHPYLVRERRTPDTNLFSDMTFVNVKDLTRKYYFDVLAGRKIKVKGLKGAIVRITREGFEHITHEKKSQFEIMTRLFALTKVLAVLSSAAKIANYEKKTIKNKLHEYWVLQEVVDGVLTKVVVRSIEGGQKSFLSVVWKGESKGNKKVGDAVSRISHRRRRMNTSQRQAHLVFYNTLLSDLSSGVFGEEGRKAAIGMFYINEWIKVRFLKPGMEIAVVDDNGLLDWQKIKSIENVGAEQVWDIQVSHTHNFVGNGIVAHNTSGILMRAGASSLQLSSSATSTTADIQLAAADRIDLFAGSLSLNTSSTSAGTLQLVSKGSLILDTSSSLGGSAPIILQGGNVGIGTTGPLYTLDVSGGTRVIGDAGVILRAGTSSLNLSSGTTSTTADLQLAAADRIDLFASSLRLSTSSTTAGDMVLSSNGSMTFDTSGGTGKFAFVGGNVGIGTTSPQEELEVSAASSTRIILRGTTESTAYGNFLQFMTGSGAASSANVVSDIGAVITQADPSTLRGELIFRTNSGDNLSERVRIDRSGNVGIGTTSPLGILDVKGDSGILLKAGAAAISLSSGTTSSSDLQLAAADRIDLFAGSLSLQTSSQTAGELKLMSKGSLILDTSGAAGGGAPIVMLGGNVGIGTTGPMAKLQVNTNDDATHIFKAVFDAASNGNGLWISQPNAGGAGAGQPTAALLYMTNSGANNYITLDNALVVQKSGNVGIGTTGPLGILDVIGNSSVLLRAGQSSLQLSGSAASTTADIQLAAADRIDLFASSFSLSTSSPSAGDIKIDSAGTLTLDSSRNNTNIILSPGTGNVGIGTTGPTGKLEIYGSSNNGSLVLSGSYANPAVSIAGTFPWGGTSPVLNLAPTFTASASNNNQIIDLVPTVGTSATAGNIIGMYIRNMVLNSGASATNYYGLYIETPSGATNNYGLFVNGGTTVLNATAGNVGIGTTSPGGILDVLGQCVTGDTLLKRRRRRRKKNGEWEEIWENARIDEVQPGDVILTLDEATGRLVPQRIIKLMDKGDRQVYELITESGKHIQTTANHPYFVDLSQKMTISNMEYLQKETYEYAESLGKKYYVKFLAGKEIYCPSLKETVAFTHSGWNHFVEKDRTLNELITRFFCLPRALVTLAMPAKFIGYKKKEKKDMVVEYWEYQQIVDHVRVRAIVCAINGGKKFFLSCNWLGTVEEVGVKSNEKELSLSPSPKKSKLGRRRELVIPQLLTRITIPRNVKWVKVVNLKPGQRIATIDGWERVVSIKKIGRKQTWDIEVEGTHNFIGNGIVAHNTTSIAMRAGSATLEASNLGTSSTTADIQLYAADSMLASVGDLTLQASEDSTYPIILRSAQGGIQLSTQSSDNGNLTLYSAGTLTLDSSRNNTNIILSPGTGNVGIGTTGPANKLQVQVANSINVNDGITIRRGTASDDYTTLGLRLKSDASGTYRAALTVQENAGSEIEALSINRTNGNVGIGTTSPGGILHAVGDASILLRAGTGAISISGSSGAGLDDIQLAAEDRIDLFAGSMSLNTSSTTAGTMQLVSKGSLILDTSSSTGGSAPIILQGGNVGIGTTAPANLLHVVGASPGTFEQNTADDIARTSLTVRRGRSDSTAPGAGLASILRFELEGFTNDSYAGAGNIRTLWEAAQTDDTTSRDSAMTFLTMQDNTLTEQMRINSAGNLGIGDASPTEATLVVGSAGAGNIYATFASSGTAALCWDNSGASLINDCSGAPVQDYAEIFPTEDGVDYGEIVSTGNDLVETDFVTTDKDGNPLPAEKRSISRLAKTNTPYQKNMIGITSQNWGDFTSTGHNSVKDEDHPLPVALSGRVPVKIDPDSEPIAVGDFLTSSDKPGLAMRAVRAGYTIGKALESWKPCPSDIASLDPSAALGMTECGKDKIEVFVNLGYFVGNMTADGYVDTQQKFIAGDVKVDLRAETYRQLMSELNLPSDSLGSLRNFTEGAQVSQTSVPADTISTSVSQAISTLVDKLEESTASQSAQAADLALLKTRVSSLEDLVGLMTVSTSSGTNVPLGSTSDLVSPQPTAGLTLNTSNQSYATYETYLAAADGGLQILGNATVGGSLTVGLITIDDLDASINSIGQALKIQNQALADVEFLGGKIVMTKAGDMKISGDLGVLGDLEVSGDVVVGGTVAGTKIEVLEQPENPATDSARPSAASIGEAVIPAGATEMTIYSTAVSGRSKVFVTPERPALIGAKVNASGRFTIELAQPTPAALKVSWWIVN